MKHMVTLLSDMEKTLEFVANFPTIDAAAEYIWSKKVGQGFTAWPIGGDRDAAKDITFIENMAELQFRSEPMFKVDGLGPLEVFRVWVQQNGYEGDDAFIVATFVASDVRDSKTNIEVSVVGDLRRIRAPRGPVFTHMKSALGQQIEEVMKTRLAESVETALKRIRGVVLYNDDPFAIPPPMTNRVVEVNPESLASLRKYVDDKSFVCEHCVNAIVPGVVFPAGAKEDKAYVSKCSTCDLFNDDVAAATCLSHVLQASAKVDDQGFVYLEGMTYEEAKRWGLKVGARPESE